MESGRVLIRVFHVTGDRAAICFDHEGRLWYVMLLLHEWQCDTDINNHSRAGLSGELDPTTLALERCNRTVLQVRVCTVKYIGNPY